MWATRADQGVVEGTEMRADGVEEEEERIRERQMVIWDERRVMKEAMTSQGCISAGAADWATTSSRKVSMSDRSSGSLVERSSAACAPIR